MSFYGNIREDMTKAQFQFDRIYANRRAMDLAVGPAEETTDGVTYKTDGVFVGRFVLVDYNIAYDEDNPAFATGYSPEEVEGRQGYYTIKKVQNGDFFTAKELEDLDGDEQIVVVVGTDLVEYFAYHKQQKELRTTEDGKALFSKVGEEHIDPEGTETAENESALIIVNSKVDKDKYGATYNGTVWQKVIYHNKEQYILVAKLNSDKPDIVGRLIAPVDSPSIQELDANSYALYYPSPWKVSGEVNFGNNTIDKYLGTKEHDFHQKNPINTVEITKTIGADSAYYDAETGDEVIGQKEDTLNFVFSIGEFKEALANFWDMIYGPGTKDQTHELEPAVNGEGNLTNENPRLLDTTFYPNKTLENLKAIKTFDPTTAAGIINLLQLYLGRGAVPVNQKAPAASEIPNSQEMLQECYENNYVLPSIEIGESGVNWENNGQPVPDFSDLYYVKKITVFTPIKDNTEDFSLVNGQLVLKNPEDSIYTKDSSGNIKISAMGNGSPCTQDEFNSLYYISGYTYTTEKLAQEDGVISLLVELMKLLGSGDKESRDPETIQGLFNTLEDSILKVREDMRNAIIWDRDQPIDKAVLQAVYGDPLENQYYTLDNVITELGNKFWSAENGHLIRNTETKNRGNEMSARLVFGEREATAYDSNETEIKTDEPQGIVYHGSKYKTSAIRFLDNEMTAGRSKLTENDIATDGEYYRYENGQYSKIDYFTFDVDFLEDTNNDGVIDYNDVGTVENSVQEVEYDKNYDYYELALNEDVYINNDANNEGNGLSIGAGGLTILGAGEGPWLYEKHIVNQPFAGEKMVRPNTEYLEILSDEKTNFYAGLNRYKNEWEAYGSHAVLDALEEYWKIYNQTADAQGTLDKIKENMASYVEAYEQYASDYGYLYTRDVNFNRFQIESQKDINKVIPQKDENDVQVYINPKQEEHGTKTYRYSDLFLANVSTEQNLEQDAATIYYERVFLESYSSAMDAANADVLSVGDTYYTKTSSTYVEHIYNGESTGLIYVKSSLVSENFVFVRIGGLDRIPATAEIEDGKYVNYFYWRAPTFEYYTYNKNTWDKTEVAAGTYLDGLKEPSLFRYLSSTYNDNNSLYFRKATAQDLTSQKILFTKLVNDVYKPVSNLSIKKNALKMNDYTGDKKSLLDVGYRVVVSEIVTNDFESPQNYYVLNEEINLKEFLVEYMQNNAGKTQIKVYDGESFGVATNETTNNDIFLINMEGPYGSSFADYFSENTLTAENFEKNIWIAPVQGKTGVYQVVRTAPTSSMTAWRALLTDLRPHIEDYRVATVEENTLSLKNSLTLEKQPGQEEDLILTNENQYLSLGGNLVYDNRRITYGTSEPTSTNALEGDIYIQLIS